MSQTGNGPRVSQTSPVLRWIRARLPRLVAIPAIAAAGASLAACGGSSAPSNAAQEQRAETKLADDAKCLREHGVKAEVATLPGGGRGLKMGPGGRAGEVPGLMQAAQKACARYQPEAQKVNLSPQQKVEREEDVQRFAKCMREHGIKVEGSAKAGRIQILLPGHPGSGPKPESPAFKQAQTACQKLLPKLTGGG